MNLENSLDKLHQYVMEENLGYVVPEVYLYILFKELDKNNEGYKNKLDALGSYVESIEKSAWGSSTCAVSREIALIERLDMNSSIVDALKIIASDDSKDSYAKRLAKACLKSDAILEDIARLEDSNEDESCSYDEHPLLRNLRKVKPAVPLIGREKEIARTIEVLARMLKSNPLHVGPPGVGKTAIVLELAQRINQGQVPDILKDKQVYSLDIADALAGSTFRGELEEKIKSALDDLPEGTIVYIDEIHTMVGAGKVSEGGVDVANLMKPYLVSGKLRFIGATTTEEFKKYFEKDSALTRRFHKIDIDEPSEEDTIKILQGIAPSMEKYHNVCYAPEALESAVRLSAYHIHNRYLPDKAIDLIDEAGAISKLGGKKKVSEKDIRDVLGKMCHISEPETKNPGKKLLELEKSLNSMVFGQSEAIKAVTEKIKLSKSGFKFDDGPIAKFLFVGPTGCGKTELAKALSEKMNMKLLRYDMAEYSEEHSVSKLFGSPAGYVGYEDGGLLVNAVRDNPNSIILFDEIEKAHPKIYSSLLGMMDYGIMTDTKGKKADFRNTIIIYTSNCGAADSKKKGMGFGKASTYIDVSSMSDAVKRTFSPEFIGRLSSIISFNGIDEKTAELIVKKELSLISTILTEKGVVLKTTPAAIAEVVRLSISPESGAREVKNIVQNNISNIFVDDLLAGNINKGDTVSLKYSDSKKKFYISKCK